MHSRLCYAGPVEDLPVPADTERSLVERYSQLGAIARDQLYSTLERHLGHVPTARKFAFLAATMEVSSFPFAMQITPNQCICVGSDYLSTTVCFDVTFVNDDPIYIQFIVRINPP